MALISKSKSRSVSIPAPVGGWNARDSLADMPITDASNIVNWFPLTTELELRKGYTRYATGITGQVESLLTYYGGSTSKMFAIAGGNFYDVSVAGAVGAAVVSGKSNSRWNYVNVATAGGNFLYAANGVDAPLLYDNTTWTVITGVSTPAITGVTTTTLKSPIVFKNRVFFIGNSTLKTWYLPVISIGGAANAIDISAVANKGGYIVAHATWTIDAGTGIDDYYVIATSRGQIVIYQGTDPSSASTWALKGVWDLGTPVGDRCLYKLAGDLLYISQDGLVPLGGALQSSRVNPRVALTDKIQYAISSSISTYGANYGWQCMYFAPENMLFLNVPISEGSSQEQYVMNTISKSWTRFTGWNANCFELFIDMPYFGGNGFVGKAWNGLVDDTSNINATCIQAFSSFGAAGNLKRWTMTRPIFRTNGSPAVYQTMNIDFNLNPVSSSLTFSPTASGTWDTAIWDNATWGAEFNIVQNWQGVSGIGYYGAPQMQVAAQGIEVRWVSTDIVYETGGIL
ncbi:MAG: hypothetical protein PHT07_20720 [Paludibacter sp.]|nr:hypothetical protein [Paludibacter sp.]